MTWYQIVLLLLALFCVAIIASLVYALTVYRSARKAWRRRP